MNYQTRQIEELRKVLTKNGLVINQSKFNQYFTPGPICNFMASLFNNFSDTVRLLDPGFGIGILSSAVVDEVIRRNHFNRNDHLTTDLEIIGYEIDQNLGKHIEQTLGLLKVNCVENNINLNTNIIYKDFILSNSLQVIDGLFSGDNLFTHIIINPPYGKVNNNDLYRKIFDTSKVDIVNLYAGFVVLAIKLLQENGEIVAIIPRSFCNGPYYESFRLFLLTNISIKHIHIFNERDKTFEENNVLQETIIIHGIKNKEKTGVIITSSENGDFYFSKSMNDSFRGILTEGGYDQITSPSLTMREVDYNVLIHDDDPQKILHISTSELDQMVTDRINLFSTSYDDLGVQVSTGPVVDFRVKEHLLETFDKNSAPLLFPIHTKRTLEWPLNSNKPNAIRINESTKKLLWNKTGYYIAVHRFSSKEEKRRIKATVINTKELPGDKISFDNKLNIFHQSKRGFNEDLAKGLFIYLNSTILDNYYRQFGGHTQVNVNDLRLIKYPNVETLIRLGRKVIDLNISQDEIDLLLDLEIKRMLPEETITPRDIQIKKDEALQILIDIGMPRAQLNERTALTLLALIKLTPDKSWQDIEAPLMGITPIMDWVLANYKESYAPNTRETFRRQSMHQLEQAGLVVANPDQPDRAINSPYYCYQITPEFITLLKTYNTNEWTNELEKFLEKNQTLREKYQQIREEVRIPIDLPKSKLFLSSGKHSELIKDIITIFQSRFTKNSTLIYVGDTGGKEIYFNTDKFREMGIILDRHGKMPDTIFVDDDKKWLFLIEAVTSHGPVDPKRYLELNKIFKQKKYGLIFVTAFKDKQTFSKYVTEISWETEVWIADSPGHIIHFDGERFLGPYES